METTHSNDSNDSTLGLAPEPVLIPAETRELRLRREALGSLEDAVRASTACGEYVETSRLDEIDYAQIDLGTRRVFATNLLAGAGGLWYTYIERVATSAVGSSGATVTRPRAVRTLVPWHEIRAINVLLVTKHDPEPY